MLIVGLYGIFHIRNSRLCYTSGGTVSPSVVTCCFSARCGIWRDLGYTALLLRVVYISSCLRKEGLRPYHLFSLFFEDFEGSTIEYTVKVRLEIELSSCRIGLDPFMATEIPRARNNFSANSINHAGCILTLHWQEVLVYIFEDALSVSRLTRTQDLLR